jgi:hypothetical protein
MRAFSFVDYAQMKTPDALKNKLLQRNYSFGARLPKRSKQGNSYSTLNFKALKTKGSDEVYPSGVKLCQMQVIPISIYFQFNSMGLQ